MLLSFYLFNYKLGEKLVRIVSRLDLLDRRSWGPHLRNSQLEKSGAYLGPARWVVPVNWVPRFVRTNAGGILGEVFSLWCGIQAK